MSNKATAIDFLQLAGMGKVQEAYEKYVASNFIHHNQYFKGDRQSLMDAMASDHETNPNTSIEVKQVLEDGDKVMTHSLVTKKDMAIAVVHIFKLVEGKIVELWDVGQILEQNSPNVSGII